MLILGFSPDLTCGFQETLKLPEADGHYASFKQPNLIIYSPHHSTALFLVLLALHTSHSDIGAGGLGGLGLVRGVFESIFALPSGFLADRLPRPLFLGQEKGRARD